MPNIKLILQYDGMNYSGWQKQHNALSIQEILERAISELISEKVNVIGCSRTDAGVHALEYVCNFFCDSYFERWKQALNSKLPQDIRVIDSRSVDRNFNARFDAKSKIYIYKVYNCEVNNPVVRNYSYFYSYKLNLNYINDACKYLIGEHNFSAFTNNDPTRFLNNKICNITELNCIRNIENSNLLEFKIKGDRFLYKMVRIIVGTLLYVGSQKINIEEVKRILDSRVRTNAGITAPSHGLYLYKVNYGN